MTKQSSTGTCSFCGDTFGKRAMAKHVQTCKRRQTASSVGKGKPRPTKIFHLVVEGRYAPEYWMHLEAPAADTLQMLDQFLRNAWLECCGHLSAFTIEGERYAVQPMNDFFSGLREKSMNFPLSRVLNPGLKFRHEYDFGSTTELALKVVSEREGEYRGKDVQVLARNHAPEILCQLCDKPAVAICTQCIYEDEGWLCEEHAEEHECGEEMLLPVVNSPRVGVCGYAGEGTSWG